MGQFVNVREKAHRLQYIREILVLERVRARKDNDSLQVNEAMAEHCIILQKE